MIALFIWLFNQRPATFSILTPRWAFLLLGGIDTTELLRNIVFLTPRWHLHCDVSYIKIRISWGNPNQIGIYTPAHMGSNHEKNLGKKSRDKLLVKRTLTFHSSGCKTCYSTVEQIVRTFLNNLFLYCNPNFKEILKKVFFCGDFNFAYNIYLLTCMQIVMYTVREVIEADCVIINTVSHSNLNSRCVKVCFTFAASFWHVHWRIP